jgi:hypothetical protein
MPVTQLGDKCWYLPAVPGDVEPHYPSEDEAAKDAAFINPDQPQAAAQQGEACWVAVCDGHQCNEPFIDEDEGGNHAASRAELEEWIGQFGWVITSDGRVLCAGNCAASYDPDREPVTIQLPGQLTFDDLEEVS